MVAQSKLDRLKTLWTRCIGCRIREVIQLQGAGTLYTITSQLTKGGDVAKTMDMKGREAAVQLIEVRM